jgi:hypothetical protein
MTKKPHIELTTSQSHTLKFEAFTCNTNHLHLGIVSLCRYGYTETERQEPSSPLLVVLLPDAPTKSRRRAEPSSMKTPGWFAAVL